MSQVIVCQTSGANISFYKASTKLKTCAKISSLALPSSIVDLVYAKFDSAFYGLCNDRSLVRIKVPSLTIQNVPQISDISSLISLEKKNMLVVGTFSGQIKILQPSTVLHQFHSAVTHLVANSDESHLAFVVTVNALSQLHLFSLASNTLAAIDLPTTAALTSISFSCFKQSLLCCGFDNGMVSLIDVFTGKVLKVFEQSHNAPVSSVKFSPFNRYLMVSVGLDKRYVLYDVEKQKVVRVINTSHPLTSLSIHSNGVLLSIGTLDGHLLIYDLSTGGKTPTVSKQTTPDSASITSSQFQYQSEKSFIVAQQKENVALKAAEYSKTRTVDQSVNYMDMFSPVTSKTRLINESTLSMLESVKKPPVFKDSMKTTTPTKYNDESLQSECQPVEKIEVKRKQVENTNTKINELTKEESIETPIKNEEIETKESDTKSHPFPVSPETPLSANTESAVLKESFEQVEIAKVEREKNEEVKQDLIETKEDEEEIPKELLQIKSLDLSHKILSGIIDDCLDDFRVEMRSYIQNLHLELLHQFDSQQRYIQHLVSQSTKEIIKSLVPVLAANAHAFVLDSIEGEEGKSSE